MAAIQNVAKSRVRIIFKSGYAQDFECKELKVTLGSSGVARMAWTNCVPDIMYIDLDQVAAVFQLS